jgi:ribosome recycling factor
MHKILENHRTAVRNIRRDVKEAIDKLEKEKKISQDDHKRALDELEKVSQAETKKIEDLAAGKEREVMEFR